MAVKEFISLDKLALFLDKLKSLIPSKTSELDNDSNFVQDDQYVHTDNNFDQNFKNKLNDIEERANNYTLPKATSESLGGVIVGANIEISPEGIISVKNLEWSNINGKPTNLSDFTNDVGFITKSVNDLINYYKKEEITSLISSIKTIKFEVVESLPETGENNIIYLVLSSSGSEQNLYDEYAWVESTSKFEKIGSTNIDLSNYWSKAELIEVTNEQINALFV